MCKIKDDAFVCYDCEVFRPNYVCRHHTEFSEEKTDAPGMRWVDEEGIQHCNDFVQYQEPEQLTLF